MTNGWWAEIKAHPKALLGSVVLAIVVLVLTRPPTLVFVVGPSLSLVACLFLTFAYFRGKDTMTLSVMALAWMFWIYFQLAFFDGNWERPYVPKKLESHTSFLLTSVFGCIGFFAFVEAIALTARKVKVPSFFSRAWNVEARYIHPLILSCLVVGWFYEWTLAEYFITLNPISRMFLFVANLKLSAYCLVVMFLASKRALSKWVIALALVSFAIDVFMVQYTTQVANLIFLVLALLLVYIIVRQRIPFVAMGVALLILLAFFDSRVSIRSIKNMTWENTTELTSADHSLADRVAIGAANIKYALYDRFSAITPSGMFRTVGAVSEKLLWRVEHVTFLTHLHEVHEQGKPYKMGETFWYTPFAMIPRALFPWKPVMNHGTELAREYKLASPDHPRTIINFPWFAEFYLNFGWLGSIVGALLMGALFGLLLVLLNQLRGDLNLVLFAQLVPYMFSIEGNIVLVVGGILQVAVSWAAVYGAFKAIAALSERVRKRAA